MSRILTVLFSVVAIVAIGMTFGRPLLTGASTDALNVIVEPPAEAPEGMVWIPGGEFMMGTSELPRADANPHRIKPDEYPAHRVVLDGFYIDTHEVTNAQFAEFVEATGYVTYAERVPTDDDLIKMGLNPANVPPEAKVPASICFNPQFDATNLRTDFQGWEYQVWQLLPGASWRHPEGPGSSIDDRMDHPVVHVAFEDAVAYCKWAGKRLATEAEWEYAARGGLKESLYPWGNEREPDGTYMCNYWQGTFPTEFQNLDGFDRTAPVGSFPPNAYGLYDMSGNLWEWTADYYHHDYYAMSPTRNPQGPKTSFDPGEPTMVKRVTRGGSFMCNMNNCTGYRCAARMRSEESSGAFHTGFRCVVSASDVDDVRH